MLTKLFFDKIEQAALIVEARPESLSPTSLQFTFNTSFSELFPQISKENIFSAFGPQFEFYLKEALAGKKERQENFEYENCDMQAYFQCFEKNKAGVLLSLIKEDEAKSKNSIYGQLTNSLDEMFFNKESFDKASSMVILTNLDAKVLYVNKKFTEVTGYSESEILGKKMNVLRSGKQDNTFYQKLWKTVLEGNIWVDSLHNKRKSGQLYWQHTQIIPLRNREGDITRFLALSDDITQSKSLETIMEEKSDLLFQLIENSPDIFCVKDAEGRWLLTNTTNLKLFGLEGISYYGKTDAELAEYIPSHKETLLHNVQTDQEAWKERRLYRSDELITLNGIEEHIFDTYKVPTFNADGSRRMLLVMGRDVSVRKRAVEHLIQIKKRFALAQKVGGIVSWEWNLETQTLNWAENLAQIFADENVFNNKTFAQIIKFVHPEDRFLFWRSTLKAIRNQEEYNFEIRILDAYQNVKWIKHIGLVHYDNLKEKQVLLGVLYDITERKNFVRDIIQAKTKAEESDRLKSTFLATMSHELRTPLNAVIGFSELISDYDLGDEVNEFIRLIFNNGHHLLNLIEDIFDVSLIESNQVKIDKTKFDLVPILRQIVEIIPMEMEKYHPQDKIDFLVDLPSEQIVVDSDASRITQIVSNLIKNAIKFTPIGYVKLGVYEQGENIVVYVKDTGIGISKEKQDLIFEIFRQGEETLTRKFGGAGLGLSLSRKLVNLLGGKMWVESKVGEGSTFSFTIKKVLATDGFQTKEKAHIHAADWSDKYVLIAEDETSNYDVLSYFLKPTGIRMQLAKDGFEAVEKATQQERPDIILMDIKMPELNGYEATKQIKAVYPDLPIIAQTALAILGDKEAALSKGCDDYIAKPIEKMQLYKLMGSYLSATKTN